MDRIEMTKRLDLADGSVFKIGMMIKYAGEKQLSKEREEAIRDICADAAERIRGITEEPVKAPAPTRRSRNLKTGPSASANVEKEDNNEQN